ncbi:hypothetical protein GWI33_002283, partial [Rhynchophorus ferrugineus]
GLYWQMGYESCRLNGGRGPRANGGSGGGGTYTHIRRLSRLGTAVSSLFTVFRIGEREAGGAGLS